MRRHDPGFWRGRPLIAGAALGLVLLLAGSGPAAAEAPGRPTPDPAGEGALRIARAAAPPAAQSRAMAVWHVAYRRETAALKSAWEAVLGALRPVRGGGPVTPRTRVVAAGAAGSPPGGFRELDRRAIDAACVALRHEVRGLAQCALPAPPAPLVAWHLRRSMTELRAAAAVCDADRYFLLGQHLERAELAFSDFSRALRRYGLSP